MAHPKPKPTLSDLAERLHADESVTKEDRAELGTAHNARIQALSAYRDAPGKQTKSDMDAARDHYTDTVTRLARQYYPDDAPEAQVERFKNKLDALRWIQAQGYKVSQGKFYGDCGNGFPSVHRDGTVSKFQVMEYVQRLDLNRKQNILILELSAEREQLEVEKLRLDVEKRRIENRRDDDTWLDKETAWAMIAALIGTLKEALAHHVTSGSDYLVTLAGGHPDRAPEVLEGANELIARAFNELVTTGVIEGVFAEETEE